MTDPLSNGTGQGQLDSVEMFKLLAKYHDYQSLQVYVWK